VKIRLNFLGAAQNVTGSSYLLEANGKRLLVDCGLYQERRFKSRNWDPFPVDPSGIDAVLLTHAHLDHCGLLPKLVADGFKGRIYATPATQDIAQIVLSDSARIQQEDVAYKKRRHAREGRSGPYPVVPLYTVEQAEACFPMFAAAKYEEVIDLGDGVSVSFHDAGHILGSSMIRVVARADGEARTIVFSGDVGRWGTPILRDPTLFDEADYVLVESTYGNRQHKDVDTVNNDLTEIINEAKRAGGHVIIPSFAVERAQELLYHLHQLLDAKRIPRLKVFVDSPMAISVTEVFKRHLDLFDEEATAMIRKGKHPCDFPGLTMSRTVAQSKAINHMKGTAIIIAGSGMCTGGRIKHHLVNNISRTESTVLFVGYQAAGTLGRIILEGKNPVRIFGQERDVMARVARINGFSAHADRDELFRWLSGLKKAPRRVFVTHGEQEAASDFASWLQAKTSWNVSVAEYLQEAALD